MNTLDAIRLRRSIRKFRPEAVPTALLREIVEVSRLYPSGGNLQPLRFAIVSKKEYTDALFADLRWAMYLPDYTIEESEKPTAYIVILRDETIKKNCDYDVGAASTMVMLAATDMGLATCAIGNFHAGRLSTLLHLPETIKPELVIALGYPAQTSRVVPMADSIRYTQDEHGNFLVPKWNTEDILVFSDQE
jgi:nitroreductase